MIKFSKVCVCAVLLLLPASYVLAETLSGRVISVTDGDTVVFMTGGNELRVRLTEIDAPENDQPFGDEATAMLADMVAQDLVTLESEGTDRYGRTLGRFYVGDLDVNREMVARGGAWVYRDYMSDSSFLENETAAREAGRGLWAFDEPIEPWNWRRGERLPAPAIPPVSSASDSPWSCSDKPYCGDMTSCAQAYFHLEQCGLQRLDRDKDGVPCESICR